MEAEKQCQCYRRGSREHREEGGGDSWWFGSSECKEKSGGKLVWTEPHFFERCEMLFPFDPGAVALSQEVMHKVSLPASA